MNSIRAKQWQLLLAAVVLPLALAAAPARAVTIQEKTRETVVQGERYRLSFLRENADLTFELRGADGQWHGVGKPGGIAYEWSQRGRSHAANGARATWAVSTTPEQVVVGEQIVLDRTSGALLDLHYVCRDDGVLFGVRFSQSGPDDANSTLWAPPRLALSAAAWDGYLFWGQDGAAHGGRLDSLQPMPSYAGVSAWEQRGDVTRRLDGAHPALLVRSSQWNAGLGVVFLDYTNRWSGGHSFLQRYSAKDLFLYAGYVPTARARQTLWAWLAPFPGGDAAGAAAQVERLVREGAALVRNFKPISPPVPESWLQPPPDFPASLRRPAPVTNINEAAVFTMNEETASDYAIDLARRSGSDLLIRGWFKWNHAPSVQRWHEFPERAHQLGALFGGGITCSALYDTENGITRAQLLDMATRGPDGELVDAWGQPGIRHGSLSSPAYLDFLFRWCREQIDAGADYLFMDEHNAALGGLEGYDDHSLNDFRRFLLENFPPTQGWARDDARWNSQFQIALTNAFFCPDGGMNSFSYRAYLRAKNLLANPTSAMNPLAPAWHSFRAWRDDRAWKTLTDRIRAYARSQGRRVLLSANGLARYVDLQVLGVWDQWMVKDGQIDLAQNQLPHWRGLVTQGHDLAERRVPVVLFHDWGMGDVPFPWMAVPPGQREIWLRTRGAEIYAAGAFFAFPVLGPFGCDAGRDGTMPTITRQTAFYQTHRDLYLRGQFLGAESVRSDATNLSLAVWSSDAPRAVLLHVINREVKQGRLQSRRELTVELPLNQLPAQASAVSPDWPGERPVQCALSGGKLRVTLPELEAYTVVSLHYERPVDLAALKDPARVRLAPRWERPARAVFRVRADGSVEHASDLSGLLQGRLHSPLRNPPTFLVNADRPTTLAVHVRAVSTLGGRLECRIDGQLARAVDLPDLDGKNDSSAAEYDRVESFPIPAGPHRVTLDNVGADWLVLNWLEFQGAFKE